MIDPRAQRLRLIILDESDVGIARMRTHELALAEGFTEVAAGAVATAISELARNVLDHARCGELSLEISDEGGRRGLVAVIRDEGPGIADTAQAMQDGYSTRGSLGLGLPSAGRLLDELHILSAPGGTTITAKKWLA